MVRQFSLTGYIDMNTKSLISSITLLLGMGAGCSSSTNNSYCDEATPCESASDESFCSISDNNCIAPPSADACNAVETCDNAALPFCLDEAVGGVCVQCQENTDCTGSQLCDLSGNSCETFSCTAGDEGNALCVDNFAEMPYCGDSQECVECRENAHCTDSATAVCENFSCVSCTKDSECGNDFCEAGSCVDALRLVFVDTNGIPDNPCGREDNPCSQIGVALNEVTATRNEIRIAEGNYSDTTTLADRNVTLRGTGFVTINYPGADDFPLFTVSGTSQVSLIGLRLQDPSPSPGNRLISCTGDSSITLDSIVTQGGDTAIYSECDLLLTDSTITEPTLFGVDIQVGGSGDIQGTTMEGIPEVLFAGASNGVNCSNGEVSIANSSIFEFSNGVEGRNCDTTLRSSSFSNNMQAGLSLFTSNFDIVNNFFVQNGTVIPDSSAIGVEIFNSSFSATTQRFDFNTVAGNVNTSSTFPLNMNCLLNSGAPMEALGNIVWDAVPINRNFELSNCSFVSSSVEGLTNFEPAFVNPVAGPSGDYHLKSDSECIDQVDTDSLNIDFDGDMRPMGIRHDMGADEAQ